MPTNPNTPDLASVLRRLVSYAPQASSYSAPRAPDVPQAAPQPSSRAHDLPHYDPGQVQLPKPRQLQPTQADPSTMTSYAPALRYLIQAITANPQISQRIRHLIQEQHGHEKQWADGRIALRKQVEGRKKIQQEADKILSSLRNPGKERDTGKGDRDWAAFERGETDGLASDQVVEGEFLRKELANYDSKVYKAQNEMAAALEKEFAVMKIPAFCIRESLVRREGSKGLKATSGEDEMEVGNRTGLETGQRSLSQEELIEFKKKIVVLLMDMCGPEQQ